MTVWNGRSCPVYIMWQGKGRCSGYLLKLRSIEERLGNHVCYVCSERGGNEAVEWKAQRRDGEWVRKMLMAGALFHRHDTLLFVQCR